MDDNRLKSGAEQAYDAALAYLFARTGGGSKYGLERTQALLEALGNPHRSFPVLHVAGTNGKGSVVATLDALLRGRGLTVARYTSPHLIDFRERIVVNDISVSAEQVTNWVTRWTPTVEKIGATFFEATTAMAFDLFAQAKVQVGVIETGLGGRLDSTNVVHPLASAVTSVGMDHVEYLGSSLESIAREKAGIFKNGAGAVVGELDPAVRRLLVDSARAAGAKPIFVYREDARIHEVSLSAHGTTCDVEILGERGSLTSPLIGRHQAQNLVTALLTLRAAGPEWAMSIDEARPLLADVRLPGRFQRIGRFVLDVAHNPAGSAVLARTLEEVGAAKPVVALLTILTDKDWRGMMHGLSPVVQHFVLTSSPTAPSNRAWNPQEAYDFAISRGWQATLEPDFDRATDLALKLGQTVVVTGSFHTVGDVLPRVLALANEPLPSSAL